MIKIPCFKILFSVFVFSLFLGCSNELEVLEKYEENASIYALLDASQTRHFVKINKVFVNPNNRAQDIAQIADSLYFDSINPFIIENQTGNRFPLYRANIILKDSGYFLNSPNYLYATNSGVVLNPLFTYSIELRMPQSNKLVSATTNIVRPMSIINPNLNFSNIIDFNLSANFLVEFSSPVNSKIFDAYVTFNYSETDKNNPSNIEYKSIKWKVLNSIRSNKDGGGERIRNSIPSITFYDLLTTEIKLNTNVIRKFEPCQLEIIAGNLEIDTYIQSSTPSIGIVQKQSEYTNIQNGVGIFASRFTRRFSNL